jgi:hypothetical protein
MVLCLYVGKPSPMRLFKHLDVRIVTFYENNGLQLQIKILNFREKICAFAFWLLVVTTTCLPIKLVACLETILSFDRRRCVLHGIKRRRTSGSLNDKETTKYRRY